MKNKIIYLDNGSTTQLAPEVLDVMRHSLSEDYGNASTVHSLGVRAKTALENARKIIADSINASNNEIFFTSGGTESNNWALKSLFFSNPEKNHIITTKIEHSSVLKTCEWLSKHGAKITYLSVDKDGFISLKELENAFTPKTLAVSVIHANNEIGAIQNLEEIGNLCKKQNVLFHTDACQSHTKTFLDVKKQNLSLVTLNAHKIHGPKGVGALFIKKGANISAWQHGGSHEFNFRAGTENIPGVVAFAEAVKLAQNQNRTKEIANLRDKLISEILKIPDTKLNGPAGNKRICNNADFSFRFIEGEAIVGLLDREGVAASTGSACAEKSLEPSHVLKAIGLSHEQSNGSLRLTLSRYTTENEINHVIKILPGIIKKLREFSPFKS